MQLIEDRGLSAEIKVFLGADLLKEIGEWGVISGMRHQASIAWQGHSLHYSYSGTGTRLFLALHGFGETGAHFHCLEAGLEKSGILLTPDLPYHGSSVWKGVQPLEPQHLIGMLQEIRARHGWEQFPVTLIGYSMGGRIALSLLETGLSGADHLVLLAPDGLQMNFWYWLATQTYWGNRLFAFTMLHPGFFRKGIALAHALRLLNSSVAKFADRYLHDPTVRKLLYIRWTSFRKFRPRLKKLAALIREKKLRVTQVYGRYDRIILPHNGQKFNDRIAPQGRLVLLETGHKLLTPSHIPVVLELLQD